MSDGAEERRPKALAPVWARVLIGAAAGGVLTPLVARIGAASTIGLVASSFAARPPIAH